VGCKGGTERAPVYLYARSHLRHLASGVLSFDIGLASQRAACFTRNAFIFVSTAMNDVSHPLSPQDRIELLCWLTCGILGAFYLNETWPTPDFHVQAAHKWLDRHSRHADWLAISKLAVVAREIAERHAGFVSAEWARDAVEEILDTDDLNHQARLVVKIIHDCQLALADKRMRD